MVARWKYPLSWNGSTLYRGNEGRQVSKICLSNDIVFRLEYRLQGFDFFQYNSSFGFLLLTTLMSARSATVRDTFWP